MMRLRPAGRSRTQISGKGVTVRRSRLAGIQLTSTSDIAFLLLIFFLSTAVFVSQLGLPIILPPAGSAPVQVQESDVLHLSLDSAGTIMWQGTVLVPGELVAWAASRERESQGRIYLLDVDSKCPYDALVQTLDGLRGASVERISFRMSESPS